MQSGGLYKNETRQYSIEDIDIAINRLLAALSDLLISAFVAVDTPIGPVYLAYGRAAAGLGSFYFFLGRPF